MNAYRFLSNRQFLVYSFGVALSDAARWPAQACVFRCRRRFDLTLKDLSQPWMVQVKGRSPVWE